MNKKQQITPFDVVEYLIVRSLFVCLRLFPFRFRAFLCEGLGLLLYRLSPPTRKLMLENLRHAFPERTGEWRAAIAKKNARMLGRQLAEFIETASINERFFERWFVPLPDAESHRKIYAGGGICILGHLGNWEWHGFLAGHLAGRDIYTLVKRQRNPLMNRYVERLRNRAHMQFLYIDQNPFITIGKLRKGELVAFTSDQNARSSGEFFPFFDRLASTYLGPASVARNTDVPVYFVWSFRDEKKRLNFRFEPIERPASIPKTDSVAWEKAFTRTWVSLLESHIKEHPEDYLWAHNRWKTQPEHPGDIWKSFGLKPPDDLSSDRSGTEERSK